jgi:hypothetical protein
MRIHMPVLILEGGLASVLVQIAIAMLLFPDLNRHSAPFDAHIRASIQESSPSSVSWTEGRIKCLPAIIVDFRMVQAQRDLVELFHEAGFSQRILLSVQTGVT